MKPLTRGIVVALIQVLIVCLLGGKLLYDRHTRPQAWFRTERYDPDLPIRGRYLSLQIEVNDPRTPEEVEQKFGSEIRLYENQPYHNFYSFGRECGSIALRNGTPVAEFDSSPMGDCDNLSFDHWRSNGRTVLRVPDPLLFFISDRAKDPTGLPRGDELWVLATIPRKGPPRPIALGVKKAGESAITPLNLN